MPRKVLKASTGCQMTNPASGTGSGLDRCTEMVASMILKTYAAGPWASLSTYVMMLKLTEMLNNGRDSSAPENMGIWFPNFLAKYGINSIRLNNKAWPGFFDVVDCIDRGHVAIGGFDDYVSLRLANGSNPYKWSDPHGLGHVLLIVGYDTDQQIVVVHDPLRADPSGQPADYSWKGFQAAQFHDCTEVVATPLPYSVNTGVPTMTLPAGWTREADGLHVPGNAFIVPEPFATYIESHAWDAANIPLEAAHHLAQVEPGNPPLGAGTRQTFRMGALAVADNPPPENAANKSVYEVWVGQDLIALAGMIPQLQAALTQVNAEKQTLTAQVKALQATQTGNLSPELAAAIQQVLPAMATIAAGAPILQAAYAAAQQPTPKPNVTAPLPVAAPAG